MNHLQDCNNDGQIETDTLLTSLALEDKTALIAQRGAFFIGLYHFLIQSCESSASYLSLRSLVRSAGTYVEA